MPNRIVREGILTSPKIAKLGWAEEVFFRRLMNVADDFGRFYADPGLLRAACYPRQLAKVSDPDVVKWTACVQEAGLVRVYPAQDGERYLEIVNFNQQVRAKASKFPQPLSECAAPATQAISNAHLGVSVVGDVSGGDVGGDAQAPPPLIPPEPPAIELPLIGNSSYPVTPSQVQEFKTLYPAVDVMQELRKMRGWCIAKPAKRKTARGIMTFITGWLSKEQDKGPRPTQQARDGGSPASRREL